MTSASSAGGLPNWVMFCGPIFGMLARMERDEVRLSTLTGRIYPAGLQPGHAPANGGKLADAEGDRVLRRGATVTLLLADVERSVRRWEDDQAAAKDALEKLDQLVGENCANHSGSRPLQQGEGDSFVLAFGRASDAIACALSLQLAFAKEPSFTALDLKVRMALHTGEVEIRSYGRYAGHAFNRCARLRALAHGGQTIMSRATCDLVVDSLPEGAILQDLGEHRLRDLDRAERIYQLRHPGLPFDFPPLRSLSSARNNLPLQVTSFIGREAEMAEVSRLFQQARIVTLTGAGGCGKTRLAIHVGADRFDEYSDGVWWMDLASVSDPELVPSAIASVLGVAEIPTEPVPDTIVRALKDRHLLLVLDNCEHLIAVCADLAASAIRACPLVSILATSREPLGIEGEIAFRIPSLPFPENDATTISDLLTHDAVRLFLDRAVRVRPNFVLTDEHVPAIAAICGDSTGFLWRSNSPPPGRASQSGSDCRRHGRPFPHRHRRCAHRAPPPADIGSVRRLELSRRDRLRAIPGARRRI